MLKKFLITGFTTILLATLILGGNTNKALAADFWSGNQHYLNVNGFTDASYYTKKATTVDFTLASPYPGASTFKGNLYLQRKSGSKWTTCKKTTFSFMYRVTKSFSLKGCKTGYYRVKATFKGSKATNTTNTFKINR
ncbi:MULTISPECIES: hypothetical protein [Bacillus]|uniref:Uncharacterized protein n=1 Tax=Bacillus cabrialesii subsp. tritici TaxID=2944916 RepID=A0ABT9DPX1_9BACI|nr:MULTISPECIES: hypothetical protein [Bacillus]AUZ27908.1 hypothetical protein C1T25_17445 [Bacillus cereus]POO74378.1 hypothetical protein C1T28_08820 [Bacillus subtilis]MDO8226759.1 hypothetical protein [Bacillus cabrialesii subsp. tritici]MDU0155342.1 hypothetical protein [Bacillus cabrialesii]MDZ5671195.1 hypothetical protein [Bacillus stercoris]